MTAQRLVVQNLSVRFGDRMPVLHDLSFVLEPGRAVALVGESGSGKSVTARSLVGLAGTGARVEARRISLGSQDLAALGERQWRALRGRQIGFVLQDALVSLDPLRPVGREIEEALGAHGPDARWPDRASRRERMLALLEQAGVPEPALRAAQRPGQLSGGLRQRALIATALAQDPGLLIADEPTTALDATVQAQILLLLQAIKEAGRSLLLISHDLSVVRHLADEILVLHHGRVVEQGTAEQVLTAPRHPYTRALLDAIPGTHRKAGRPPARGGDASFRQDAAASAAPPILEARGLVKRYPGPDRAGRLVLDAVSFSLHPGRTLGIVGESGSGKTTVARIALGLTEPDEGEVSFDGQPWAGSGRDAVRERDRRRRRPALGVVPQDPLGSFDPRWSVGRILSDALQAASVPGALRPARVETLLHQVRLAPEFARRTPLTMSGGQRQRVAIARALAGQPRLIVCDEPVSALDVSVQAQILDLLADLQNDLGVAYLFISHDLGVIRQVSDEVMVMKDGRVIETGPTEDVFLNPLQPFTRQLLDAAFLRSLT